MHKIYISEWLGIDLKLLPIELSSEKLANGDFYETFYKKFFSEVRSFQEIKDLEYIPRKQPILEHLTKLTTGKTNILSIGCGLGYLESELSKRHRSIRITGIEPGFRSAFLRDTNVKVLKGYFPDILNDDSEEFDFVYAIGIDYAFTDAEYMQFLKSIINYGFSEIFIADVYLPETGLGSKVKALIKEILIKIKIYNPGQFWGYLRTLEEHKEIIKKAGFSEFEYGNYPHSHWIKCKK